MNKLLSLLILLLFTRIAFSQMLCPEVMEYGVNVAAEYSGSGHGTNITANMVVLNDYKSFELGAVFSGDDSKLKGAGLKYKNFVGRYNYYYGNALIKPYVIYNCLCQMEYVFQPVILNTPIETIIIEDAAGGRISTIEHYVGAGVMLRFLSNFYFDTNMGIGAYFGSLDKTKAPNKIGFHDVNSGLTANMKVGIGYILR